MIDPQLSGKIAIVTGINNPLGIGASIAERLAAQGVAVFGTFLRLPAIADQVQDAERGIPGEAFFRALSANDAEAVVRRIRDAGGRIDAQETDLADPEACAAVFDACEAALGPPGILVNNAAHSVPDSLLPDAGVEGLPSAGGIRIERFTVDQHDRHFHVNVRAAALLIREFARRHIEAGRRWGRIVSVSTDGASGFPSEVSYGASKHALESITRAAACELGPFGITANIVSLGPIQTGYIPPEAEQRIIGSIPLGRLGRPDDVADVVVFLASEQARWLTGQLVYVGGGHQMGL